MLQFAVGALMVLVVDGIYRVAQLRRKLSDAQEELKELEDKLEDATFVLTDEQKERLKKKSPKPKIAVTRDTVQAVAKSLGLDFEFVDEPPCGGGCGCRPSQDGSQSSSANAPPSPVKEVVAYSIFGGAVTAEVPADSPPSERTPRTEDPPSWQESNFGG